jgi:hypothetical protein
MTPGELGFLVGKRGGGDQVGSHPISAVLAQPAQITSDVRVQGIRGRPVR